MCLNRQGGKGAKSFISEPLRSEGREGLFVGFVMILEEILRIRSEQSPDGPVRHRECQRLGLAGKSMQRVGALKIYERMAFT